MFVDEAKIFVKAGDGGNGCRSFERIPGRRYGRPNGGPGGRGGNIVIVADNNKRTLLDFRYNKHFRATSGTHGSSNHKKGHEGKDCVIRVPPGTIIHDASTGMVLRDVEKSGEGLIVAKGGGGGRGNSVGHDAAPGEKGEERELYLELKLVADVGIIGYPNAGKSTLLSKITSAKPRIADFPFTTKSPILGVARVGDFDFVVADIPGLIEGAHAGRGLGDRFLRHSERTGLLLHLVDMASVDGYNPNDCFKNVNKELTLYSRLLSRKKQLIVANKMDLPKAKELIGEFGPDKTRKVYRISALTGEGIDYLLKAVVSELKKTRRTAISGC